MTDVFVPPFRNNPNAPFIYFDAAPFQGSIGGAIEIELTARTLTHQPNAATAAVEIQTVAHLRCSPAAALNLREALNAALKLFEESGKAQSSETQKLN